MSLMTFAKMLLLSKRPAVILTSRIPRLAMYLSRLSVIPDPNTIPLNPITFSKKTGVGLTLIIRLTPRRMSGNRIAFNAPVRIESDSTVLFEGIVIDVLPNVTDGSVRITASDKSRDLRESEVSDEFGLERYVSLGQPDDDKTYTIPQTAGPIQERSVEALVYAISDTGILVNPRDLNRTDVLGSEGIADPLQYTVNADTSLQTANDLEPENHVVHAKFYEPLRWKRVETLVKRLVEDADPDVSVDVQVPTWKTKDAEFCTRGRVGWEVEGGESLANPPQWGYTGYVRDFVVNPANNDAFFLYGGWHNGVEYPNAIIHYDHANDAYTRYPMDNSHDKRDGEYLSCWRLTTTDFQTFYVLGCVSMRAEERANVTPPPRKYPFGNNYNASYRPYPANNDIIEDDLPRIVRFDFSQTPPVWDSSPMNMYTTGESGERPQLGNYIHIENLDTNNPYSNLYKNIWADTRRLFRAFTFNNNHYLAYIYQKRDGTDGVAIYRSNGDTIHRIPVPVQERSKTLIGSEYGIDEVNGMVYRITVTSSGTLTLSRVSIVSISGNTWQTVSTILNQSAAYNVTDILVHTVGGVTTVYGTEQSKYDVGRALPKGRLVRFRSNNIINDGVTNGWERETIKEYPYYIFSARGGVVHNNEVYYFEGGLDVYGNPAPIETSSVAVQSQPRDEDVPILDRRAEYRYPTGTLIEVSTGDVVEHGLVWRSSYSSEVDIYDYGAHTAILAPLQSDGNLVHCVAGYGDILKSDAFPVRLQHHYTADDLLEEPQNDINNWQWVTFGYDQELYIERFVVREQQRIWQILKELAALTYSRLYFENDTLYFKSRAVYAGYATAIDDYADNYSVNENLISVHVNPLYSQIKNQIRGNIQYLLPDATPPTDRLREEFAQDPDSVKYIGKRILDVEMGRLTHHQVWWARMLAERLLVERSKAVYEADFAVTWAPDLKVGDIVQIDVRDPSPDLSIPNTVLDNFDVQVVSVTQKISTNDDGFTTEAVGRKPVPLPTGFKLPYIRDFVIAKDAMITETLPAAVGSGTYTYALKLEGGTGLPTGVLFNTSTRQITGASTKYGTFELEYTATDNNGQSVKRLFKMWVGTGILQDFQPVALAVTGGGTVYLIDNNAKKARGFKWTQTNGWIWIEALDITLDANGEYQDATIGGTDYNLIVLDKSGNNDTLKYYHLTPGNTYGTLDTAKGTGGVVTIGEGNWQGIAFKGSGSVFSGLLLALNHLGGINTYNDNGTLNTENAAKLDLCADYQSITAVSDTLYATIERLSTVLAWDLSMAAGSGVALFPQEFVETNDKYADYTGVAEKDGTLFVCRANRSSFFEYDT